MFTVLILPLLSRAKAKMENMIIARQNLDSRQKSADSLEDPGYSWVRGFKPEMPPPKPETPAWTPPKLVTLCTDRCGIFS